MAKSMQHWNGNQLCAIDTETTGLDAAYHEIWQIAILPLDSDIKPRKDVLPFFIEMRPEHPERVSEGALKLNRDGLLTACGRGHDPEKAKDMLQTWIAKLGLPVTKGGYPKRIIPLGQNYAFDIGFIKKWLGISMYDEFFDYHYCDTMIAANYLNDRAAWHAEKVPFSKINLTYLASTLKIPHDRAHDALADCQITAAVYRSQLTMGLLG